MFRPKSEAKANGCDRPGWLLEPCGNARPRGMAAGAARVFEYHAALQNPAYRPPGEYTPLTYESVAYGEMAM